MNSLLRREVSFRSPHPRLVVNSRGDVSGLNGLHTAHTHMGVASDTRVNAEGCNDWLCRIHSSEGHISVASKFPRNSTPVGGALQFWHRECHAPRLYHTPPSIGAHARLAAPVPTRARVGHTAPRQVEDKRKATLRHLPLPTGRRAPRQPLPSREGWERAPS